MANPICPRCKDEVLPADVKDFVQREGWVECWHNSCRYVSQQEARVKRSEDLERVLNAARNLVLLWQNQKVAGLPRADRNAAIEGCREQLILAVAEIDPNVRQQTATQ